MVLTNVGAESRARVEIVMAISRVPGPHIRPASAADAPAIHVASWKVTYASMVGNVGMDAHTPDDRLLMWMRILGDPESPAHVWVAEIDGTVSGFCSIGPARTMAGAGELYTIYPNHGREGHGLGHALITRAEAGMAEGQPIWMDEMPGRFASWECWHLMLWKTANVACWITRAANQGVVSPA